VKLQTFAQFGYAQFVHLIMELFQQVEGMGYRLDEIFGFFFFCHGKYLERAVAEERSGEMKRQLRGCTHEVLQVPH